MWTSLSAVVLVTLAHTVYGQSDLSSETRECLSNKDCPNNRLCAQWMCVDPCRLNFCGDPSNCKVINHVPVCACRRGFSGPLNGKPTDKSNGKKKYHLNLERMNWYEAHMACSFQGMRLATIESQEEQEQLVNLIKQSDIGDYKTEASSRRKWWLGGADLHNYYDYVWFSSGKPITYRKFRGGQPDSDIYANGEWEHCIEMVTDWNYEWGDFMCAHSQFFVCEYFE